MFSTLRTRFGIPGVISVMALVFAMFGGAYAASNSSDGGKATASAKAKKGPRGPKGATGPAGPAGPQGPAGSAGAKGDAGAAGAAGASVTNTTVATGIAGKCNKLGGTEFTVGGGVATFACNGKEGPEGEPGEPWAAGGTLPPGATETGTWAFTSPPGSSDYPMRIYFPISFPIPLEEGLDEDHVHFFYQAEAPTGPCSGSVLEPKAESGHLCIYTGSATGSLTLMPNEELLTPDYSAVGAGPTGTVVQIEPRLDQSEYGFGSWAVTG